jgi:hypothetical protein
MGGTVFIMVALNCSPCSLSLNPTFPCDQPIPGAHGGSDPTTVVSSGCPFSPDPKHTETGVFVVKVTRSMTPEICSVAGRRSGIAAFMWGFILQRMDGAWVIQYGGTPEGRIVEVYGET